MTVAGASRHVERATNAAAAEAPEARGSQRRPRAIAYLRITKPRIVELLLVTAVPPMILAAGGWPDGATVFAVVVGGALAAGGANAVNCWVDRDRDALMSRTASRPLPAGEILPARALGFGVVLNLVAFGLLAAVVHLLAASLTLSATLFYVFVYSMWLKPRTDQNIVIGGAAGAVPVLVGWSAVTGGLDWPAVALFAVVFLWTPAHFWSLALKYREDYTAAGVPMLPSVRGAAAAGRQIAVYAALTVAATLTVGFTTAVGPLYVAVAGAAGLVFVGGGVVLARDPSPSRAVRFFGVSNAYLAVVFAALAADVFAR